MRRSVGEVLEQLCREGLATTAARESARAALAAEHADHIPWYLRVAIGFGAWLATGFLLGFTLAIAPLETALARLVSGAALVAGAVWFMPRATSDFRKHAAVAAALAGQGLLIAGLYELTDSVRATAAIIVLMGLALLRLVPDSVHRFLTALAVVAAGYVAIVEEGTRGTFEGVTVLLVAATALTWRFRLRERAGAWNALLRPVGYALVVALLIALVIGSSTHLGRVSFDAGNGLALGRVTTAAFAIALGVLVRAVLDEHGSPPAGAAAFAAYTGVAFLALTTMSTPGILAGAWVLALACDRGDRVLAGMGIVFLLAFGTVYYYNLDLTLLEKSGVLTGSGALLLAIRHRLARA